MISAWRWRANPSFMLFEFAGKLRVDEMTYWRTHLTPDEAERVKAIAQEIAALRREHRQHFDRARKRAIRKRGVNGKGGDA